MEMALALIYIVGFMVAMTVIRSRAGVGQRKIKILGPTGFGLSWFLSSSVAIMFWPVTLAIWLARGRPEARVVFNHKAEERQRRRSMQS
jgi:hypothetical protein